MPLIFKGRTIENSATTILARSVKPDGSPRLPADVTALTLRVYENKTGTLVVPEGEDAETYEGTDLVVADVILSPVVTADDDVRWTEEEGYNLRLELHGSHFPEGGKVYQIELKVTPASGDPGYLLWQITTENIWSE